MAQSQGKQISTQSNLKFVQEYSNSCNKCLTLVETIQIVTVLNDFVENGYSKEIKDRFEKIDQLVFGKKPE
jgi:alkyl hydroperoxide reductase subunit AhpF